MIDMLSVVDFMITEYTTATKAWYPRSSPSAATRQDGVRFCVFFISVLLGITSTFLLTLGLSLAAYDSWLTANKN